MVNPGKRMNILKALLDIRHGPGAAILPAEITRIHLNFAFTRDRGHYGPRKFWKTCLPRLKYWNPAIPMIVNRSDNNAGPATMTIYVRQSSSGEAGAAPAPAKTMVPLVQQPRSSTKNEYPTAPPAEADEQMVTVQMRNRKYETIMEEVLHKTGARVVQPTPEERSEMRQVEELRERAAVDRAIRKKYVDDKRREERLLLRVRQEAEAIKLANQ